MVIGHQKKYHRCFNFFNHSIGNTIIDELYMKKSTPNKKMISIVLR